MERAEPQFNHKNDSKSPVKEKEKDGVEALKPADIGKEEILLNKPEKEKAKTKDSTVMGKNENEENSDIDKSKGELPWNTLPIVLKKEEICEFVDDCVHWVTKQTDYDKPEVKSCIALLSGTYFRFESERASVARILCTAGFPDYLVKMMEFIQRDFHNDVYVLACNFSDVSLEFSKLVGEAGLIKLLLPYLKDQPHICDQETADLLDVPLTILFNISKVPEVKNIYRKENAIELVKPFLSSNHVLLQGVAAFTLANIIDENENEILEEAGCFVFLSKSLKKAIMSEDRRGYYLFSSVEMTEGLANLAVNDRNKMKIIQAGVLPSLVTMMKGDIVEEQKMAAKCCWTLSFGMEARQKLKDEEGCIPALEALAESDQKEVQKMAAGALWKIQGKGERKAEKIKETTRDSRKKHVFISYNHKHKEIVHRIADRLQADSYKLWIDRDNMAGSTIEAMASAVENAAVVIVCVSEYYKLSPACQSEAEYAYNCRIPIIPLMVQRNYKPDGWLGLIVGVKLYIRCFGITMLDVSCQDLKKELNNIITPDADTLDGPIQAQTGSHLSAKPSKQVKPNAASWKAADIKNWLSTHGLDEYKDHFEDYDGTILLGVKDMRDKAPDFFYSQMKGEIFTKLTDLVRFTQALNDLD